MSRVGRIAQIPRHGRDWHERGYTRSWQMLDVGERHVHERTLLASKGFETTTHFEYDPVAVEYVAILRLHSLAPSHPPENSRMVFEHREPMAVFPSDELITKIILVVG